MLRTGGNRDQLVRLANGVRLVDGGRRRQCNFPFSDNTPRRLALAEAHPVTHLSHFGAGEYLRLT